MRSLSFGGIFRAAAILVVCLCMLIACGASEVQLSRKLAACPIGRYSVNGQDSPSACQHVAAGYYPSMTAAITTPATSTGQWYGITASPDFRYMAAALRGGDIFMSSNSGVTWMDMTGAGIRDWRGITSTPDFTKLAATVDGGSIYVSTDSGLAWNSLAGAGSEN